MKNREKGILTVEASFVLTIFIFFVLFLFSFARIYAAQSLMSHAVIQSADATATESYLRETVLTGNETEILELAHRLTGSTVISADSFESLRSADLPRVAKEKFSRALSANDADTDKMLKSYGVKDGLSGVDFSASRIDLGPDDIVLNVKYTLEMQFPVLGFREIEFSKSAKAKTLGDILFPIEVVPYDPLTGSAQGSGSYRYGEETEIAATPAYGYKFVRWDDGNTDNPRKVTVLGEKRYTAYFEADSFGVNVAAEPVYAGSVTGGGAFAYLSDADINAVPNAGYSFLRWRIVPHDTGIPGYAYSVSYKVNVDRSYTCTAEFKADLYTVKTQVEGVSAAGAVAYIVFGGADYTSLELTYGVSYALYAPAVPGHRFLGWKVSGETEYFSVSPNVNMTVQPLNATYIACYEPTLKTVRFYNSNGSIYAVRTVNAGETLGNTMPADPRTKQNVGQVFNGWSGGFNRNTVVYSDTDVYGSWRACTSHRLGDCGIDHAISMKMNGHGGGSSYNRTVRGRCLVCVDCGVFIKWNSTLGKHVRCYDVGNYYGANMPINKYQWCSAHTIRGSSYTYNDRYWTYTSKGQYYVHG